MKKILVICIMIGAFFITSIVYADEKVNLKININGKIEAGEHIEIDIRAENVKSFFAGEMNLKYNPDILKIISIERGNLINNKEINFFEAENKIDGKVGIVKYSFSCLGKTDGYKGTGDFVKIKAIILKKENFHIKSKPFLDKVDDDFNLKVMILDKDIKEQEYAFSPYEFKNTKSSEIYKNNNSKDEVQNKKSDENKNNEIETNKEINNIDNTNESKLSDKSNENNVSKDKETNKELKNKTKDNDDDKILSESKDEEVQKIKGSLQKSKIVYYFIGIMLVMLLGGIIIKKKFFGNNHQKLKKK